MVEAPVLLSSMEQRRGDVTPHVLPEDYSLNEEPDLAGPGQPPRKIGIGGGLEDFGGDSIPPQPPTAEGDETRDPFEMAAKFSQLWNAPYPGCGDIVARLETESLINRTGLVSTAKKAVTRAYTIATQERLSPSQVISPDRFEIELPAWRERSLGIFSSDEDLIRGINLRLLGFFEKAIGHASGLGSIRYQEGQDMVQEWRKEILANLFVQS